MKNAILDDFIERLRVIRPRYAAKLFGLAGGSKGEVLAIDQDHRGLLLLFEKRGAGRGKSLGRARIHPQGGHLPA